MQQPWKKPKQKAIGPWNPVMQTRLFPPIATRTEWRGSEPPPPRPCLVVFLSPDLPRTNTTPQQSDRQHNAPAPAFPALQGKLGREGGELGRAERIWGWRTDRIGKQIPSSPCAVPGARMRIVLTKETEEMLS